MSFPTRDDFKICQDCNGEGSFESLHSGPRICQRCQGEGETTQTGDLMPGGYFSLAAWNRMGTEPRPRASR